MHPWLTSPLRKGVKFQSPLNPKTLHKCRRRTFRRGKCCIGKADTGGSQNLLPGGQERRVQPCARWDAPAIVRPVYAPAHGASDLPRSPRNVKSRRSPVLWENPGCLGTVGEQRRGTEPRFGGSCRPGAVTQRPRKAGAGVWRSTGVTGAGTSPPDADACSTGVKGAPGKLGDWDRGGSQWPSVLSQGCELPPESQEELPKNAKQGSKVI